MSVEFGLFDWIDHHGGAIHDLYEDRLALVAAADAAGFYGYHLAEHHGTPLGMAASPSVFLAAVAQRTRRIRLGPLVYLLPLYEPLRLVEEICMLDHLSGGRLEIGVGRGVSPWELGCFNVDPAGTRPIFEEALAVIVKGMTSARLTFAGEHFRYDDVPMELHPLQRPYPGLWYPTHNPASIEYAARHGFHFIGAGPATAIGQQIETYRGFHAAHVGDDGRLNGHVVEPKLGAVRQIVVAERDDEAFEIARSAFVAWNRSISKLWHEHDDHSFDSFFSWETAVGAEILLWGSPERVRGQVERLIEQSRCNYVIGAFAWGTLPRERALCSLELFAERVMPEFSQRGSR